MKNYIYYITLLGFLLIGNKLMAQNPKEASQVNQMTGIEVKATFAEKVGKTLPVRDLPDIPAISLEKRNNYKKNRSKLEQFQGASRSKVAYEELEHTGADSKRQIQQGDYPPIEPIYNMPGLNTSIKPSDPTIAVGPNHVMQAVNASKFRVFDKATGEIVENFASNALWSSLGLSSIGDPIVLFDHEAQRWIITELAPFAQNRLFFAISENEDPTSAYELYTFSTPSFPDFPKWAIWDNAYTMTTGEDYSANLEMYVIDREAILNGVEDIPIQRLTVPGTLNTSFQFYVATPVCWNGSNAPVGNPLFTAMVDESWGDFPQDAIRFFEIDVDFDNPFGTSVNTVTVPVADFDSYPCTQGTNVFSCAPQMGPSNLHAQPELIMNLPTYRNFGSHESVLMNFISDVTNGDNVIGIRWIEFRRSDGSDWEVYQEGTMGPDDGNHRYMGSVAQNGNGDIALGYSISSNDLPVGLRITGRKSTDPLGELTFEETVVVEGSGTLNSSSRFGDYSQMWVDPIDQNTFWFTGEYAEAGVAGTRIVSFKVQKDSIDVTPYLLLGPEDSDDLGSEETITVRFKNAGYLEVSSFPVGYILNGGTPVLEEIGVNLDPGESIDFSFETKANLSELGSYELEILTALPEDQFPSNDSNHFGVKKIGKIDAGITGIDGLEYSNCNESDEISIELNNLGTNELNSVNIMVSLNGFVIDTLDWTGSLAHNEVESIPYLLEGFNGGSNEISISTNLPNGMIDETIDNDAFYTEFVGTMQGVEISIVLNTDAYPTEIYLSVEDQNETTLFEAGPFPGQPQSQIIETLCLADESCFSLVIYDSHGDGIDGNLTIQDADGTALGYSDGNFGSNETIEFCTSALDLCFLSAEFSFVKESQEGANDGALLIVAQSGNGPFEYSIDGGQTFQNEALFEGLAAGDYELVVRASDDCEYIETITLKGCVLSLSVEVSNESVEGNSDGELNLSASGGIEPYTFSIDNGENFTESNTFNGLSEGPYNVIVQDFEACQRSETVSIDYDAVLSTELLHFGLNIEVFPNPTDGIFRVNLTGYQQESVFLPVKIYDASGRFLYEDSLVKYDDTFTKSLALKVYPAGIYYVRFIGEGLNEMIRVVKK